MTMLDFEPAARRLLRGVDRGTAIVLKRLLAWSETAVHALVATVVATGLVAVAALVWASYVLYPRLATARVWARRRARSVATALVLRARALALTVARQVGRQPETDVDETAVDEDGGEEASEDAREGGDGAEGEVFQPAYPEWLLLLYDETVWILVEELEGWVETEVRVVAHRVTHSPLWLGAVLAVASVLVPGVSAAQGVRAGALVAVLAGLYRVGRWAGERDLRGLVRACVQEVVG